MIGVLGSSGRRKADLVSLTKTRTSLPTTARLRNDDATPQCSRPEDRGKGVRGGREGGGGREEGRRGERGVREEGTDGVISSVLLYLQIPLNIHVHT